MLEGLQAIVEKSPVVSTVNADDLLDHPGTVEGAYRRHVETFIPMGDTSGYSSRLGNKIVSAKTPKGLIVAPYGYGKTSTLAFLWNESEREGLVSVPPFYCSNLLDILKATYGWVYYRIQAGEPMLLSALDEVYQKYTMATVEEMAKRYAQDHGLAPLTAKNMFNEMLDDGSLVLELTPSNLLFFLDEVSNIVIRAGFSGLLVLPDEFQQYFSKGANLRRTIQEFREFVWGIDTRAKQFGVVFSIPTYAESVIQDQGKDILHRLKTDGLYYRLQDIYSVDFPTRLWVRYGESFGLQDVADEVIDPETLRAIGQLAEREDLGEGPRTVVDSFKRAILHYQDFQTSYTPIDLIDDFLESNISFQSQTNKLKTVTRQALDSTIVDNEEKRKAIKLLAAFPRGCPTTVQKAYDLYESINALSKQAHGELMTHLVEGYTLLGLSRVGGPTHTVDIITTRYWQSFEEDELHLEAAIRAFINRLLPKFFEQRRGTSATGWGTLDFASTPQGGYTALIEGTFNPQFPRRRLALQLAQKSEQIQPISPKADFQFEILFGMHVHDDPGSLTEVNARLVRIELNLRRKIGPGLPEDLRKLQDFVNPEFVTPLLMLGLVDYFDRWEEIEDQPVPESDRAEIEYFISRLVDHSIQILLNQEIAVRLTPPLRRIGRLMLEELFNRLCRNLYQGNYYTFYMHPQYESVLDSYINAMSGMTLKERRGHTTLEGTKEGLARRFGLSRVATFENRIDSEYEHLLEKVEWSGRGDQSNAELRLRLHPLESEILEKLRSSDRRELIDDHHVPVLRSDEIADLAQSYGYRDEETLQSLKLLAARGYTRLDPAKKIIYLAQIGPDSAELQIRLERLVSDLDAVKSQIPSLTGQQLSEELAVLQVKLREAGTNDEELDELQANISDLRQQIDRALTKYYEELRLNMQSALLDVERVLIKLKSGGFLERGIEGQVAFVMHLNELRQRIADTRHRLAGEYSNLRQSINQTLSGVASEKIGSLEGLLEQKAHIEQKRAELDDRQRQLGEQMTDLENWIRLQKDSDRLFDSLQRLPELRKQLTQEVVPEIQAHLTKRQLAGLSDWEPFESKIHDIEKELEKRRRHGNDVFGEAKETYEKYLRQMRVSDYRPKTRYTYGEDEESYNDLYAEVREKIGERLNEILYDIERVQTDLLKAKYVSIIESDGEATLEMLQAKVENAVLDLGKLEKSLTVSLIRKADEGLEDFVSILTEVANLSESVRRDLSPLMFAKHDLTNVEENVLQNLESRADLDLTDLFVALHKGDPNIDIGQLLDVLEGLYRKHRILIRIRPRG